MDELNLNEDQVKLVKLMEEYIMQAYNEGFSHGFKAGQMDSESQS